MSDDANERPIHILHIFGKMNRGGAELRTIDVMRSIDRARYKFHFCVLAEEPGQLDEQIVAMGGTIHRCAMGPAFPILFRRVIRSVKPDVVHSHINHLSGLFLRLAAHERVPVRIAHFRSSTDGGAVSLRRRLQRTVMLRWIDKHATHIVAVSRGALQGAWLDYKPEDHRCRVIYNGFDLPTGTGRTVGPARSDPAVEFAMTNARVCVHVGRFVQAKNHQRLIEIFGRVHALDSSTVLLLIGGGEGMGRAQEQVKRLKLENAVHFLGERSDVFDLLQRADLMIFPSLWEGLPGAVVESCAAGTPVLASNLPGTVEIADFFPSLCKVMPEVSTDADWAEAALDLLRSAPSSNAQSFKDSPFTMENCISQMTNLWEPNSSSSMADVRHGV